MSYFIFNNKCSLDEGIIIEKMPPLPKPKKKVNKISVPGRNGDVYQDEDAYESMIIQIQCALIDEEKDVKELHKWLDGEGKLVLSTNPNCFYYANIINKIDFTNIVNQIHEFPLEIELQPICYGLEEKSFTITENTNIVISESSQPIFPYIKVYGNGNITLTINNSSIILKDVEDYIELDCEEEEAFKNSINKNFFVECDEFPKFDLGENSIEFIGDVSKVEFVYREAYI